MYSDFRSKKSPPPHLASTTAIACLLLPDTLGLRDEWKSWQALNQGHYCWPPCHASCRPCPRISLDFSHLLEQYYRSCKPSALPAFRCPLSPRVCSQTVSRRRVQFIYPCRASQHTINSMSSEALDVPSNIR